MAFSAIPLLHRCMASCCLLVWLAGTAWCGIGDALSPISLALTPTGKGLGYCPGTNQFHVLSGSKIALLSASGAILSQGTLSNVEATALSNAMAFDMEVLDSNSWICINSANIATRWQLSADAQGNLQVSQMSSFSLEGHLKAGESYTGFAIAPGGSLWLSGGLDAGSSNADGFLLHLNASGGLIRRYEDYVAARYFIAPGSWMGSLNLQALDDVAVETATGRLVLRSQNWLYYMDPSSWDIAGRFYLSSIPAGTNLKGGPSVLYFRGGTSAQVQRYFLEAAGLPEVTGMQSFRPRGILWTGVSSGIGSLSPGLRAVVDWRGTPGAPGAAHLFFMRNGAGQNVFSGNIAATGQGYLDASYLIPSQVASWEDLVLHAQVVNGQNQVGPVTVVPLEQGIYAGSVPLDGIPGIWSRSWEADVCKWSVSGAWPQAPITNLIKMPDWFPFIGGKSFGVEDLQAGIEYAFASSGPERLSINGGGAVEVADAKVGLKLGGGARTELTAEGLNYPGGFGEIAISGSVKHEAKILDLVPGLSSAQAIPIIGRVVAWINHRGRIEGTIFLEGTGRCEVAPTSSGDLALSGENGYGFGISCAAIIEVMKGIAEASAYGEGRTVLTLRQIPLHEQAGAPFGVEFKEWVLRLLVGAKMTIYGVTRSQEQAWVLRYPEAGSRMAPMETETSKVGDSGWRYTFDPLDESGRARSLALPTVGDSLGIAKPAQANVVPFNTEQVVLQNLSVHSAPFVAQGPDGKKMAVWVQQVNRNVMQNTDIYFSYFDGSKFSAPAAVSADTRADYNPKVAWHKSGLWVAVWERVGRANLLSSGDPLTDAQTQLREMVPAYAVFDPATRKWSATAQMANAGTCYHLKLATGPSRDISALWFYSADHEIFPYDMVNRSGVSLQVNVIRYARFVNGKFEAAQDAIPSNRYFDYDAADSGSEIRLATTYFSRITGTAGDFDARLYLFTYRRAHNSSKSGFDVMHQSWDDSDLPDHYLSPRVLAMSDGSWRLAWKMQVDGDIYSPWLPGRPAIKISDAMYDFENPAKQRILYKSVRPQTRDLIHRRNFAGDHLDDYQLGDAGNGQVFAVVKDQAAGRPNLHIVFDEKGGVPSEPGALQADYAGEKRPSVFVSPTGEILVTYLRTRRSTSTAVLSVGGVAGDFTRVGEADKGDLVLLTHTLGRDLAAGPVRQVGGILREGCRITLSVEVRSLGSRSAPNPKASVYARNLATNEVILLGSSLPVWQGVMPGHASATVEVSWVVPEKGSYEVWAVVDPGNAIGESSEANNTGLKTALYAEPYLSAEKWELYE